MIGEADYDLRRAVCESGRIVFLSDEYLKANGDSRLNHGVRYQNFR
jgi:hypothetical protein